jgi:hypothetical protein
MDPKTVARSLEKRNRTRNSIDTLKAQLDASRRLIDQTRRRLAHQREQWSASRKAAEEPAGPCSASS